MKPLSIVTVEAVAVSLAALAGVAGCGGGGAAASTASGSGGPAAAAAAPNSTSTSVGSPTPTPTPTAAPTPAPAPIPHPTPSPHPSPSPTPSGSTPAPTPAPVSSGSGTTINLNGPIAITYDPIRNVLFEAETGGSIREVSLGGNVSTVASGVQAPSALAVQPSGPLYVAEATDRSSGQGTVASVDPSSGTVTPLLSGFYAEGAVVQGDGTVALSKNIPTPGEDSGVWVFNPQNGDLTQKGADLEGPRGVARIGTALLVLNTGSDYSHPSPPPCTVEKVQGDGSGQTVTGQQQCGGGPIAPKAQGIAADSSGNLYIADTPDNRILRVTSSGAVSVLAGSGAAGDVDANGSAAEFNRPSGIVLASDGNLYVADTGNNSIRRVTLSGAVSTLV